MERYGFSCTGLEFIRGNSRMKEFERLYGKGIEEFDDAFDDEEDCFMYKLIDEDCIDDIRQYPGLEHFRFVSIEAHPDDEKTDSYQPTAIIFEVNGVLYRSIAIYSSWDATEPGRIEDITKVKKAQKIIEVWAEDEV